MPLALQLTIPYALQSQTPSTHVACAGHGLAMVPTTEISVLFVCKYCSRLFVCGVGNDTFQCLHRVCKLWEYSAAMYPATEFFVKVQFGVNAVRFSQLKNKK